MNMKKYTIREGASFRMDDGSLKVAGEVIELPSDVALMHAGKVAPVAEGEPEASAEQPAA